MTKINWDAILGETQARVARIADELREQATPDGEGGFLCPMGCGGHVSLNAWGIPLCDGTGRGRTQPCDPRTILVNGLGWPFEQARDWVDGETDSDDEREIRNERNGRLLTVAELRNRPEPRWIVKGVAPAHGIGQLWGGVGFGKTFVAIDFMFRVANGVPWYGHEIAHPVDVVYVAMEGSFDISYRYAAWLEGNPGCTGDRVFTLAEESFNWCDDGLIRELMHDIVRRDVDPGLIVVDTQALATAGTDENSNTDMGRMVANMKWLSVQLNAVILNVHHTGHGDNRARGASAQHAAMDLEISIPQKGVIRVPKVKAGKELGPFGFELVAAGHSVFARATQDAHAVAGNTLTEQILAAISASPGISKTDIHTTVGGNKKACFDEVDRLAAGPDAAIRVESSGNAQRHYLVQPSL